MEILRMKISQLIWRGPKIITGKNETEKGDLKVTLFKAGADDNKAA